MRIHQISYYILILFYFFVHCVIILFPLISINRKVFPEKAPIPGKFSLFRFNTILFFTCRCAYFPFLRPPRPAETLTFPQKFYILKTDAIPLHAVLLPDLLLFWRCCMKISVGSIHTSGSVFFDMFIARLSPQTRPSFSHFHTFAEVSIVLKGTGTYTADSEDHTISPGDLFFFSSNSLHYITNATSPLELLTLQFPTSLLTNTTPVYAAPSNWRLFTSPIAMHLTGADAKPFHLLMGEIQKNLTEQPADYIAYIHSLIVI